MSFVTHATAAWWLLACVQLSGIVVACLVRSEAGRRLGGSGHALFFALLALTAVATLVALSVSPTSWFFSSAGLAAMVLVAIVDFGGSPQSVVG